MRPAFSEKDLVQHYKNDRLIGKHPRGALLIIILALDDSPLRSMQDCDTIKAAWDRLQLRSAGQTMMNQLGAPNNLCTTTYKNDTDVRNHVRHLESQM